MDVPPRVVHRRRATITALPLYYSGHLLKKSTGEKDFKKCYGELRGSTIFLYKDDSQDTYTEKLDLEQLKSMELDSPYERKTPTIFTLTLHTQQVQLKMENPDTGEEWRGFILTVVKKEIPSDLQLLPGQMLRLEEALTQEKRRNPPQFHPPLPPRPAFLPALSSPTSFSPSSPTPSSMSVLPSCFYNVTRQEAEQMLEDNPECGSIIVRPSLLPNSYAITLRQVMSSGPVMKHYRVTSTNSKFVIELDSAVTVSSLDEVLKYFLEKTAYRLHPYIKTKPYDTRIEMPPAAVWIKSSSATPKTVPKAQVAPMKRSRASKVASAWFQPQTTTSESEYEVPDDYSIKQDGLDSELREVLQKRRETIYSQQQQATMK